MHERPARKSRNPSKPFHKYSLIGTARLEAPYIREWIQYHLSLGFDHIYIYCNDDDPDECYEQVLPFLAGDNPPATFVYYEYQGLQTQMFLHFLREHSANSQWIMFLDLDEFLYCGQVNQIEPFVARFQSSADAIFFNWLTFGNNGYETRPSGSVLKNYTRREKHVAPFTKVLVRSDKVLFGDLFASPHFPIQHDSRIYDRTKTTNVLGDSMESYYQNFPDGAWAFLYANDRLHTIVDCAFVAHYSLKSEADFEHRIKRGLIGDYAVEKIWGEISEIDRKAIHERQNFVFDDRLSRYWSNHLSKGRQQTIFPPSRSRLASRKKLATQSSTAHQISLADDAGRLVDGDYSAEAHNHTLLEDSPWWRVDLGSTFLVSEVRVFNRLAMPERMKHFDVDTSLDDEEWSPLFSKDDDADFGGVETTPYVRVFDARRARYLRITVPGKTYLHLRQVEVYGLEEG